jgi:osmoprotectant transport system substrate-binding protein
MQEHRHERHRNASAAQRLPGVALIFVLLSTFSCTHSRADRIVIGSKNFTESLMLAELMAQQIEAHTHLKVERRFYLAGTYICQQAILAGRIDLYPEYTGTALTAILKEKIGSDRADVYRRVKDEYKKRFNLTLGPPLGFNDTFAMEIRGEDARRLNLKTLSQAVPFATHWHAGFGYEFMERPDGYPGLAAAYDLHFDGKPRIMDLGLLAPALKNHEIDIAAGNATDGLIPALDFFVLEDDRRYFPPYEAVAVMRDDIVRQHPDVAEAVAELGDKISDREMQELNYALDGQHRDPKEVAHDFLQRKGLIY